jgi:hypothetical protein
MAVAAATAFLARRWYRKLSGFNNSVMVGPCVFQSVSEKLDGGGTSTPED